MKKAKKLLFADAARAALASGLDKVARAVSVTLGPKGKLVLLSKTYGPSVMTKDGVSVAREIALEDEFENEGAKLCIEVASKCNSVAGDGTTTATVLAAAMVSEGLKYVAHQSNAVSIKKGIDKAVENVLKTLSENSQSVNDTEEVKFVASISGNDSEVGTVVADAFNKVGHDGVVTFEETRQKETTLDLVEGLRIDRGMISPYFATDPIKMKAELEDPIILLWGERISSMQEIAQFIDRNMATGGNRPFLIVADDVVDDALATIILNHHRGVIKAACIKSPGFGERKDALMSDIAALTGGVYLSNKLGRKLNNVTLAECGTAKKVIITRDDTTFVSGAGTKENIEQHLSSLKAQIEESDSEYDKEKLRERVAKLSGGVAVIRIGASTDTELIELKHRYEDAISATKAAIEEGIVPGGGIALLNCIESAKKTETANKDEEFGVNVVVEALQLPLKTIVNNAGVSAEVVLSTLMAERDANYGYDAKTGQYVDMFKAGIIDPVKVTRSAVEYAASIAGMILTTEALVVELPEKNKESNMMPMM